MNDKKIDWPSFLTSVAIILAVCIPLVLFPGKGGALLESIYRTIAEELGILYLLASVAAIGFLLWLACSRFGAIKLSSDDEPPQFSYFSWVAMLFCSGIGAALMYWCAIEWSYYYVTPPFGAEPRSAQAAEWASTYGLFHWGFTAWAFYCLPSLGIAYPYYRKKLPSLRFSNAWYHFLKGRENGALSRFIDFLLMIAIIAGAGSSLAFCTPMIAASVAYLFGLEYGFWLELLIIGLSVAIFATSVWLGLNRGMKNLSDLTLVLAFLLLVFVLLAGPTAFLLRTSLNGVGLLLQNFVRMNFWTDPIARTGFVENWTIFYWAWWLAYAPFVGLFVTRISRGRSIRELIIAMVLFGSLGCWVFYMVIGNYSMHLELSGQVAVTDIVTNKGGNHAIAAVLGQLPLPWLVNALWVLMSLAFAATTYDAAAQALSASVTRQLPEGTDPARWLRVFWAFAIGVLPATLMYVGGLKVVQTGLLVVSLPILVVCVVMCVGLVKTLNADFPRPP